MYPLSASVLGQDVRTHGSQVPPPRRVGSRNALFESVSALSRRTDKNQLLWLTLYTLLSLGKYFEGFLCFDAPWREPRFLPIHIFNALDVLICKRKYCTSQSIDFVIVRRHFRTNWVGLDKKRWLKCTWPFINVLLWWIIKTSLWTNL